MNKRLEFDKNKKKSTAANGRHQDLKHNFLFPFETIPRKLPPFVKPEMVSSFSLDFMPLFPPVFPSRDVCLS